MKGAEKFETFGAISFNNATDAEKNSLETNHLIKVVLVTCMPIISREWIVFSSHISKFLPVFIGLLAFHGANPLPRHQFKKKKYDGQCRCFKAWGVEESAFITRGDKMK